MGIKTLWLGLIVLFTASCSEYMPMTPGTYYKRDMQIEIQGQGVYEGVSVVKKQQSYDIIIEPKDDDPDLIIIRSCHREDSFEKGQKNFLFIPIGSKKFQYKYTPIPDLETDRVCPLRGDAYHSDKNNSQHSWFFLDFENNDLYKLKAYVTCSGTKRLYDGVSVCQAKKNLVQVMEFGESIIWADPKPSTCEMPIWKYGHRWELKLSLGECLYHARNKAGDLFRITTIGYEGIQLRREQ